MTTPLVERLRNLFAMSDDRARQTRDEAADRIEKLEKALRSLRHTAEHGTPSGIPRPCTCRSCEVIRKAMEET
jgi:hypothetical protein